MKTIIINDEAWFKNASLQDVKMLGIRFLGIPADRFTAKKSEQFQRALVRQMFVQKCDYGQVVKIEELVNPIKIVKPRGVIGDRPSGGYRFIKAPLRVPENDIRWEMFKVLQRHDNFEAAFKEFESRYGVNTKFKLPKGKMILSFKTTCDFALKSGWLERTYDDGS